MSDSEFLYKYRSLSPGVTRSRTLEFLESNRVFFSSPSTFNDPFGSGVRRWFQRLALRWRRGLDSRAPRPSEVRLARLWPVEGTAFLRRTSDSKPR